MKGSADSQNLTWVQMQGKYQKMSSQNSKKVLEQIYPSELQEQHSTASSDNRKGESAAELDCRLSKLVEEVQL